MRRFVFSLIFTILPLAAFAEREWDVVPAFTLTGISGYSSHAGKSAGFDGIASTFEIEFRPISRPYYSSLFIEYLVSSSRRFDETMNIGALARIDYGRWDTTGYLVVNKAPGSPDTWLWAGRVRYRVLENHKVGIEFLDTLEGPDWPFVSVGYYGDFSDALSLKLITGTVLGDGPEFVAKLELSWSVL